MQREIEALLAAYLADRDRETKAVQELLTALAIGSANRRRMLTDFAAAMGEIAGLPADELTHVSSPSSKSDLAAAIHQFRSVRTATAA